MNVDVNECDILVACLTRLAFKSSFSYRTASSQPDFLNLADLSKASCFRGVRKFDSLGKGPRVEPLMRIVADIAVKRWLTKGLISYPRQMHGRPVMNIPVWILFAVLLIQPATPQAVNNTPSPRDQNYVLFGKKGKRDSDQVRALRGTVVDSAGHPVSGATVQLKDVSNSSVRTVTSDRDGLFRFDELSLTQGSNVEAIYKGSQLSPAYHKSVRRQDDDYRRIAS